MKTSDSDNHKTGKQRDDRKEKLSSKQKTNAASSTTATGDKSKTHYHTPHAF